MTYFVDAGRRAAELPFLPRWESRRRRGRAAPTPDLLDHLVGLHRQSAPEARVAVPGDVVVDVLRVDQAAVAQRDPHLGATHRREIREPRIPAMVPSPAVPSTQSRQWLADHVGGQDPGHVVRRDRAVDDPGQARHLHVQQRLRVAEPEAADGHDGRVHAQPGQFPPGPPGRVTGSGGQAAGGRADRDDRSLAVVEAVPAPPGPGRSAGPGRGGPRRGASWAGRSGAAAVATSSSSPRGRRRSPTRPGRPPGLAQEAGVWRPWARPLATITGASAHEPKHAAVSSVHRRS